MKEVRNRSLTLGGAGEAHSDVASFVFCCEDCFDPRFSIVRNSRISSVAFAVVVGFFYSVANVATQTAVKVKETVEGKVGHANITSQNHH